MTDRQLYLLDRHHRGQLTSAEKIEFDDALKIIEFQQAVELSRDVKAVIEHQENTEFRKKMEAWEKTKPKSGPNSSSRFILITILVFLTAALTYWLYERTHPSETPEMLYAEYAQPYKNIYLPLSRSKDDETQEMKAMAAYENKQYTNTLELINAIPLDDRSEGLVFYQAIAHVMLEHFDEAQPLFLRLENSAKYEQPAIWYRFLMAVRRQDEDQMSLLSSRLLKQKTHPVLQKKTKELLSRLHIDESG